MHAAALTKKKSKGIVSWPEEERPRERLLGRGPEVLTDSELTAILIRVGFKGTSAVELGRQLLRQFGSIRAMVEARALALCKIKGLKGLKQLNSSRLWGVGSDGAMSLEDQEHYRRGKLPAGEAAYR